MSVALVEGWTERIRDVILADGEVQDLTGMTVELVAYDRSGHLVEMEGTAGIEDAANGIVYFAPSPNDLKKGKYKIRWKITDSGDQVAFCPNEDPEEWIVSKP